MVPLARPYLVSANIQETQIRYLWDDWNIEQAEEPVEQIALERYGRLSHRAIVVFIIGSAEWIVYRLQIFTDVTEPLRYLEAAWAQVVDWRYGAYSWEERAAKNEWTGPVKGPIGTAMLRVTYGIQQARENAFPELRAAWIANLASYVMPDPAPYRQWCEFALGRLEHWYARQAGDTLGDVVPRQVLDPAVEFHPQQTESLINAFLAGCDYKTNDYLNSPQKMLGMGFPGRPYTFDIQQDRQRRAHV